MADRSPGELDAVDGTAGTGPAATSGGLGVNMPVRLDELQEVFYERAPAGGLVTKSTNTAA